MGGVSLEVLVGGSLLEEAGHGAQDSALLGQQDGAGGAVHHVEALWSHDGRIHVAVVDQITYNLDKIMTLLVDLVGKLFNLKIDILFNLFS